MEFDEVIKRRKSVRSFKGTKVSWKDVLDAIDISNQGPFASNQNHMKYVIVEDDETIKKISEICDQEWIAEAGTLVVACSDDLHLENVHGDRGRIYSRQQAGAAIYALILKLADLGIGSCWVGSYEDSDLREVLDIPENFQIEAVIPVGYENEREKKKDKKDLENALYWEKWGNDKRPDKNKKPFLDAAEKFANKMGKYEID